MIQIVELENKGYIRCSLQDVYNDPIIKRFLEVNKTKIKSVEIFVEGKELDYDEK